LLDIDTDDDPNTINDMTEDPSAAVRIILAPTEPEELINGIWFGLGGSCLECEMVHYYGTAIDLPLDDDWTEVAELYGTADYATTMGCPDDPGYHLYLYAEPLIDYFVLSEPMFIATFDAWVADPVPPGCLQPASNLASMFAQGEDGMWNYVQIGGEAVAAQSGSWTTVKATYR
jgi:hypothetical protein